MIFLLLIYDRIVPSYRTQVGIVFRLWRVAFFKRGLHLSVENIK